MQDLEVLDLPLEIILHIIQQFEDFNVTIVLSQTCKFFHNLLSPHIKRHFIQKRLVLHLSKLECLAITYTPSALNETGKQLEDVFEVMTGYTSNTVLPNAGEPLRSIIDNVATVVCNKIDKQRTPTTVVYLLQILQYVVRVLLLDRLLFTSHSEHVYTSPTTHVCIFCRLRTLLRTTFESFQSSHIFGVTERVILLTTRMMRDISDIDYKMLEILVNMMDSRISAFQRDGATKALTELPTLPPQCVSLLIDRIKSRETVNIINNVQVLCYHGYQSSIYDIVKDFLNPNNWDVNNWRPGFVEQVVATIKMLKIMENRSDSEIVVGHLFALLQKVKSDHWAEMEVITAIESLGYKDEKLINGLEMCLVEDKWGANSNGVRDAIVSTLQSFGVTPQGRTCMDILWRDKLQQGRLLKFRLCVLVGSLSFVLFLVLFFTQMYGEIAALDRVVETTGKVVDLNFEFLPTACTDKLCYDVRVSILYPYTNHSMPNSCIGDAIILCAVVENICDCCNKFPINSTITCYFDPQNPKQMFIKKGHESYSWQFKVFNTFFWPGLLLLLPVASIWPLAFYAWRQSRVEKGELPLLSCFSHL